MNTEQKTPEEKKPLSKEDQIRATGAFIQLIVGLVVIFFAVSAFASTC